MRTRQPAMQDRAPGVARSGDVRDLVCIDAQSDGGWASHGMDDLMLVNSSIFFRGA